MEFVARLTVIDEIFLEDASLSPGRRNLGTIDEMDSLEGISPMRRMHLPLHNHALGFAGAT